MVTKYRAREWTDPVLGEVIERQSFGALKVSWYGGASSISTQASCVARTVASTSLVLTCSAVVDRRRREM